MNVSLNFSQRTVALWVLFLLGGISQVQAQSFRTLSTAKNFLVSDTIKGNNTYATKVAPFAKKGAVNCTQISNGTQQNNPIWNQVTYTPAAGFVGIDTFAVQIDYSGNYPYLTYQIYIVKVFPSILKTKSDYAQTSVGQTVNIPVLDNDMSSSGPLSLTGIPLVNHGTAQIMGNTINFTPDAGFTGVAHLNYQACDPLFECAAGSADINVIDGSVAQVSGISQISTAKNTPVSRVLSDTGYTVQQYPTSGTLSVAGGYRYTYAPNVSFIGLDSFILVRNNHVPSLTQTIYVDVFNTPTPNTMAMDDYYYTPKNTAISFNVRANDYGTQAYTVSSFLPPAANKGTISGMNAGGNGQVTFTPAQGFSGVATFKYTVQNTTYGPNSLSEVATVNVVVGDMDPALATFNLTTPIETPIIINYEIPFLGFDFYITDDPDNGNLALYAGTSTQTINGQSVTGYNMLVYTPDAGFAGNDEITLDYCLNGGSSCYAVKLDVSVVETVTGAAPFCVEDCVWTGDVNNDGIVNNKDILPLGYFMGEEGNNRPGAALEWYGQYGTNWANPFYGVPFDMKHADTDGNGSITSDDADAVDMFYGQVHKLFPNIPPTNKGLPFYPQWPTGAVGVGDHVVIPIHLGNAQHPVSNLYGFTYDVSLSPIIVDSAMQMNFDANSYLNADGPYMDFSKRPRVGRMESAFTRTNGVATGGYGYVGYFEFIVDDIVEDIKTNESPSFTITIDQPTIMLADGSVQVFESQSVELPLRITPSDPVVVDVDLQVYPNPTTDLVRVYLNGDHIIQDLSISDAMGKQVYQSGTVEWERAELSVSTLPTGVYFVHAKTTGGVVVKKLQVVR